MKRIFIVDDEPDMCRTISLLVEEAGYSSESFQSGEDFLRHLKKESPDLILLDQKLSPEMDGITVMKKLGDMDIKAPVIIVTGYGDVNMAVEALKLGARDFITKPFKNDLLVNCIKQTIEKYEFSQDSEDVRLKLSEYKFLEYMMGNSPEITTVFRAIEKVATTDFTVLIYGETGTGKEIVARAIHNYSHRKDMAFVAVDCGSIPETLIESELFGYRKGAFTGASEDYDGRFQQANKGTILLDEISNLSYDLQKKLLRVIQERKVQKIGSRREKIVDVRIIAATNLPLDKLISHGKFREDLFYRLNEFSILIPPLRERKDDIPQLARRFLKETEHKLSKGELKLSQSALAALQKYNWPGNVRELRNVIRRAAIISDSIIMPEQLALNLNSGLDKTAAPEMDIDYDGDMDLKQLLREHASHVEKYIIEKSLEKFKGNKSAVARYLKIDYKTLLSKIKHLWT